MVVVVHPSELRSHYSISGCQPWVWEPFDFEGLITPFKYLPSLTAAPPPFCWTHCLTPGVRFGAFDSSWWGTVLWPSAVGNRGSTFWWNWWVSCSLRGGLVVHRHLRRWPGCWGSRYRYWWVTVYYCLYGQLLLVPYRQTCSDNRRSYCSFVVSLTWVVFMVGFASTRSATAFNSPVSRVRHHSPNRKSYEGGGTIEGRLVSSVVTFATGTSPSRSCWSHPPWLIEDAVGSEMDFWGWNVVETDCPAGRWLMVDE